MEIAPILRNQLFPFSRPVKAFIFSIALTCVGFAPAFAQRNSVQSTGTISGRVFDQDTGAGIRNIQVFVYTSQDTPTSFEPPVTVATTNDSGSYRTMTPLQPGEYFLIPGPVQGFIGKDFGERTTVSLKLGEDLENVDFQLSRGVSISGTVRNAENEPVQGIRIIAGAERAEPNGGVSDGDGKFEVSGFRQGDQVKVAVFMNEGYADMTIGSFELPSDGLSDLTVVLTAESRIEGRVVDSDGNPVSGRPIYVGGQKPDGSFVTTGLPSIGSRTDSDGYFSVVRLASGSYRISVPQPDEMLKSKIVEVGHGERVEGIELLYDVPGLVISGRVTDPDGNPVARVQVESWGPLDSESADELSVAVEMASALDYGGWAGRVTTDAEGYYKFEGRKNGEYALAIQARVSRIDGKRINWIREERLGVKAGTSNVNFELVPESKIRGRVVDASGAPVPRMGILIDMLGLDGEFLETRFPRTRTDDGGAFEITRLLRGRYRLRLSRPHLQNAAMAHAKVVEIETGEHVDGIEFLFDNPGLTISGRVTLSDGTPIVNASVQCRGPEGSTPSTSSAKTNSDGRYTTLDLPAGSYSINVIVFDDVPIGAHQTYWVGSRQNVLAGEAGVDIVTLSPIHDRSHDFVGNWTVTYENDTNPFLLTLMPDGSALKSRRNDRATFHGKWVVVDGHALITWDDGGWRDAIYAGPPAENWAYAPGLDLNLAPSAKGEARQISVTP